MGSKRKLVKKKPSADPLERETRVVTTNDTDEADLTEKVMERLPHLAAEMATSESEVQIEGVRWEETDRTQQPIITGKPRYSGYSPDVIDFLRRCQTQEEALEIIKFLENRGEITGAHAKELRKQLRERGMRSFGSKKVWGHYERQSST
ncbi:MAG: DUF2095 family protein [Candidatus Thorarchaeota archaeon]